MIQNRVSQILSITVYTGGLFFLSLFVFAAFIALGIDLRWRFLSSFVLGMLLTHFFLRFFDLKQRVKTILSLAPPLVSLLMIAGLAPLQQSN